MIASLVEIAHMDKIMEIFHKLRPTTFLNMEGPTTLDDQHEHLKENCSKELKVALYVTPRGPMGVT